MKYTFSKDQLKEFIKDAKEFKNYNIYKVFPVKEKGHDGIKIIYSVQLSTNTFSTQKNKVFWNMDFEEISNQFIYN